MPSSKTKTLVLGGGVGGVVVATELRKALPREHSVSLVEKDSDYCFSPSYLWLMTNDRTPKQISRPMKGITKHGVELLQGNISTISPESRTITMNGASHSADYLVVSLGAEYSVQNVPGLAEAGLNLYTMEGAAAIRDALPRIHRGRVVVLISSMPFKCPAAPYEAAMLLDSFFAKRGLRKDVEVAVYTPEPGPMPVTGPQVSGQVKSILESKNIRYFPQWTVKSVNPSQKQLLFASGETAPFDLLIYVPPHCAPAVVRESGLTGNGPWVQVDRSTLETRFSGVYAIGDVTGIMLSNGKPLPKAGVFAHRQAETVARRIAHAITGKGSPAVFDGHGECFLEVGHGRAGLGRGNFYAEPAPAVTMKSPSLWWHYGKVFYEKYWLYKWY